jgi:hypothetical protein
VDGVGEPLVGEGVLAAQVDEAELGADGEAGDRHGLDEGEGVLLHAGCGP